MVTDEKFEMKQHEQYLVNLFLAVIGKDLGFFETQALMIYIEKMYNQVKEDIIPALEEIISGSFSSFLPETFNESPFLPKERTEDPDTAVLYRPVMRIGMFQQPSSTQIRYWRFIKDPNVISASNINKSLEVKKEQKIFPDNYSKGSYLELGQVRNACSFLIGVAQESESSRNDILNQFCPVNMYIGNKTSNAIVPWISLLFSLEHRATYDIPEPSSAAPEPPARALGITRSLASDKLASDRIEVPYSSKAPVLPETENASQDYSKFRQHYKDMLWLIEKVSLTSISNPQFPQKFRNGFNNIVKDPKSIGGCLIGDNHRSNCCYSYEIYNGPAPDIQWIGRDWEWFRSFSRGFSLAKIYQKENGILIPIFAPRGERVLEEWKDRFKTVLLPVEGIALTQIYQKYLKPGK